MSEKVESARPTDAQLDEMRRNGLSIDGDNAYKRDLIDCIVGTLAFGKQGTHKPPEGHWAELFWDMACAEGELLESLLKERDALKAELQLKHEAHRKTWRQAEQLSGLVREILAALPTRRDWLDPVLEMRMAAALSQQAEPTLFGMKVVQDDTLQPNEFKLAYPKQAEPAPAQDERDAFEERWAIRGTDDEGNPGRKPLRSLVDQQRYRGDAVNGSWVWFQRGAAWQRTRPAQTEQQPVCWASSTALAKLQNGRNNSPCVLTDGPAEFNDTPLYTRPA